MSARYGEDAYPARFRVLATSQPSRLGLGIRRRRLSPKHGLGAQWAVEV